MHKVRGWIGGKSKSEHRQKRDAGTGFSRARGCGYNNVDWIVFLTDFRWKANECLEALLYTMDLYMMLIAARSRSVVGFDHERKR